MQSIVGAAVINQQHPGLVGKRCDSTNQTARIRAKKKVAAAREAEVAIDRGRAVRAALIVKAIEGQVVAGAVDDDAVAGVGVGDELPNRRGGLLSHRGVPAGEGKGEAESQIHRWSDQVAIVATPSRRTIWPAALAVVKE